MNTEIIKVDPNNIDTALIARAADIIKRGGLVAFPTETVYGLGADSFNPKAVADIFKAKGRPMDNPLISHIWEIEQVYTLAREVPQKALELMERFWGGPLTIILKKRPEVPMEVCAGLDTVSIRMPGHSIAHELILQSGTAIAAPSANISGSPSPTCARHCIADLYGRVDMIIDGGSSFIGLESTVVDMTGEVPTVLRPGAVTAEEIAAVTGECVYGGNYSDAPKCPGMKYTHYSPKARVFALENMENAQSLLKKQTGKTAVIALGENKGYGCDVFYSGGEDLKSYAARLFYFLRKADEDGVGFVAAQLPENKGIGAAIRNRLLKSAGGRTDETDYA